MATNHLEVYADGWDFSQHGERARTRPLDWLSRLGIGLLSLFSEMADDGSGASAQGKAQTAEEAVQAAGPLCCYLASTIECRYTDGQKYNYLCPSGYNKTWWYCCYGQRLIGCGECSKGTNCYSGPWACSIWWDVPGGKCS